MAFSQSERRKEPEDLDTTATATTFRTPVLPSPATQEPGEGPGVRAHA